MSKVKVQDKGIASLDQTSEANDSSPEFPMDQGLQAWLQVLGSWILFANTWGLTNTFGVFETYYHTTLLPDSSPSAISWIGSIQLFLTMFVGTLAGRVLDKGHLQFLLIGGTIFEVFGMFMTSLCDRYWQVLLAQGICVGIGSGMLGLTSVAVIPLFFDKRKMMATGIAATGSSLAGIIYSIMIRRLTISIGFPWAVRALTFLILGCQCICCAVMRLRPRKKVEKKFQWRAFWDLSYLLFTAGFLLEMASVYVPFFYIQTYALKLSIDTDMAFYLLAIMNASSLFGRLGPNYLGDRLGGITIMAPCCLFSGIILFLWRFAHDLAGLVVIAIVYGFVSGGMVSLPPAIIAHITEDKTHLGARIGFSYTVAAFGALIGNPCAGATRRLGTQHGEFPQSVQEEYQGVWMFAGSLMILATVLLVWVVSGGRGRKFGAR